MTTLVLLPGMDGTGQQFSVFIDALGRDIKTVVIRYPIDKVLGYRDLIDLVRDALPGEKFFLLGESFSGPIALSLAAENYPQLQGLILTSTFCRNPMPVASIFRPLISRLKVTAIPKSLLSFMLLGEFASDALRSEMLRAIASVSPAVLSARLDAVLAVDVSRMLSSIRAPCLYLRASRDRLVRASEAEEIKRLAPQTQIVTINAPHLLLPKQRPLKQQKRFARS